MSADAGMHKFYTKVMPTLYKFFIRNLIKICGAFFQGIIVLIFQNKTLYTQNKHEAERLCLYLLFLELCSIENVLTFSKDKHQKNIIILKNVKNQLRSSKRKQHQHFK